MHHRGVRILLRVLRVLRVVLLFSFPRLIPVEESGQFRIRLLFFYSIPHNAGKKRVPQPTGGVRSCTETSSRVPFLFGMLF